MGLVTAAAPGQALVDNSALLETREAEFALDTSKPFKVNGDTNGVCELSLLLPSAFTSTNHPMTLAADRVLYTPTRLAAIASEAAKSDSIFSLSDRIGLVHDSFALGKAGYLQLSAALNLVHELRAERECACPVHAAHVTQRLTRTCKSLGLGQHRCELGWCHPYVVGAR